MTILTEKSERHPSAFRTKGQVLAMHFRTNSESDDANMNAICEWYNNGKGPSTEHAWHNGTNIFIYQAHDRTTTLNCGDWLVFDNKTFFRLCDSDFQTKYDYLAELK